MYCSVNWDSKFERYPAALCELNQSNKVYAKDRNNSNETIN